MDIDFMTGGVRPRVLALAHHAGEVVRCHRDRLKFRTDAPVVAGAVDDTADLSAGMRSSRTPATRGSRYPASNDASSSISRDGMSKRFKMSAGDITFSDTRSSIALRSSRGRSGAISTSYGS